MKEKVEFKPVDYDPVVDSLFVMVPKSEYEHSVMLGDDVILDFGRLSGRDKLDVIGFEILEASKKFGLDKHLLRNIKRLYAEIKISEDRVEMMISIVIVQRKKERERSRILEMANVGLPTAVTSISV
ncbi:DUF2283 domain-containing protein [Thermococcus sp. SY098]|uniref:DUF2283 domain-containing protein n=1 Tax=Thermococcus sp. SY098 TaxID=3111325 RepID=UPI002D76FE85|nr:DUF2283 domain-containing protein [Thermococcus sp. SY098]WRS52122.1 DUF2283 domain-containing protein [Thermococcus sp. SY098]